MISGLQELARYRRMLHNLLALDFLREVGQLRQLRAVTPTLRKDPQYACFYRLYREFDRAITPFDGGLFRLGLEKVWQLYEYWCFFQVLSALRDLTEDIVNFDARSIMKQQPDRDMSFRYPSTTRERRRSWTFTPIGLSWDNSRRGSRRRLKRG